MFLHESLFRVCPLNGRVATGSFLCGQEILQNNLTGSNQLTHELRLQKCRIAGPQPRLMRKMEDQSSKSCRDTACSLLDNSLLWAQSTEIMYSLHHTNHPRVYTTSAPITLFWNNGSIRMYDLQSHETKERKTETSPEKYSALIYKISFTTEPSAWGKLTSLQAFFSSCYSRCTGWGTFMPMNPVKNGKHKNPERQHRAKFSRASSSTRHRMTGKRQRKWVKVHKTRSLPACEHLARGTSLSAQSLWLEVIHN